MAIKVGLDTRLVVVLLAFALFGNITFGQRHAHDHLQSMLTPTVQTMAGEDLKTTWAVEELSFHEMLDYPPTISQERLLLLWGVDIEPSLWAPAAY